MPIVINRAAGIGIGNIAITVRYEAELRKMLEAIGCPPRNASSRFSGRSRRRSLNRPPLAEAAREYAAYKQSQVAARELKENGAADGSTR